MVQLTVTHANGSTDTIDQTIGRTRTREVGKMRKARIDVERDKAQAANLVEKEDDIQLGSIDTLRLVDIEPGGAYWTLVCYSYEWLANTVEPTAGGSTEAGSDTDIISALAADIPDWSTGTLTEQATGLSFILNHAYRHEALRRVERNVPGEILFRDQGTIDYVDSLGTDKSGSITLSAANQNIEDEITITKRGRELDGTHIRVLGAHEGEAQYFANLVPADDPASYDNRVNYTTGRWSAGDTRDWDRWQNKDVADQATIEEEAAALADEITDPLVEAKATVSGEDVSVGDTVRVVKSDADLDREMRIHRIKTVVEGATETDEVLLSTRSTLRRDDTDDLRDIQRFNTAFQGSAVVLQGGGGRQPVTSSINAVETFRYPVVDFEHIAEVEVAGLPYRAYSSGSLNNSDFSNVVSSAGNAQNFLTLDPGWNTVEIFDIPFDADPISQVFVGWDITVNGNSNSTNIRVYNVDTDTYYPIDSDGYVTIYESTATRQYTSNNIVIANDIRGDRLEVQVNHSDGSSTSDVALFTFYQAVGKHTHDPDPGVIEAFPDVPASNATGELLPSGVDLLVNGSTVATDIGTGEFTTTVDVSGEFNQGQFNTIEATSDSIGHLRLTPFIEAYKKIGTE